MKLFTAILLLFSINIFADSRTIRDFKHANNDVMDGVFAISSPSSSTTFTSNVSYDPFSDKTNKYAESRLIRVLCKTKGCNIRFGDSSIGAAVTTDYEIIADNPEYFGVDSAYPYVRIIENSASSVMQVTEIY